MALNKYFEKIVDLKTGEETYREFTSAEIAEIETNKANAEQLIIDAQKKQAAQLAIIQKLGLTEEEAKLLLS